MENLYPKKWNDQYLHSYRRQLLDYSDKIDFASNDYLGFAKQQRVKKIIHDHFDELVFQGSTGSRLISGNKKWIEDIEKAIADFHHTEACLIFPSTYQANVGLFSCIADRNDLYLIDEHIHASVYDGIRLSFARYFKFKHNDVDHLKSLVHKHRHQFDNIYIVVEGLYSMDGDSPDIVEILTIIDNKKCFLILDEAHSFGVIGEHHLGLCATQDVAERCLIRIIGYGKALGFSGGAIVGSEILKRHLVNFSRSFIFSTALPLYHYQIIFYLYNELMQHSKREHDLLQKNIQFYLQQVSTEEYFSKNTFPIQYYLLKNNTDFSNLQQKIIDHGLFAKVILPPTVKPNEERVRISLHAFNTENEITHLINILKTFSQ